MRLRRCRLSQIDGQTSDLVLESKFTSGCSACNLDKHNQQLFLRETEQERGGFAAMPRPFQLPTGNSRFAGLLPDSEVIQRVEIAESPVKRAFRGATAANCILFKTSLTCHISALGTSIQERISYAADLQPLRMFQRPRGTHSQSYIVEHIQKGPTPST